MNFTPHREGYPYIAAFVAVTVIAFLWLGDWVGFIGIVLVAWCVYFFRDPERAVPEIEGVLISPADGVVCMVTTATPPADLALGESPRPRISIFMNVFDCHVNRMPIAGKIIKMAYRPGKFLNASLDKASEDNERQSYHIRTEEGDDIACVQIAGLIARRIVSFVGEEQSLERGQRFGMIRFGSRVDVYLANGMVPNVSVGQRCFAGETIICDPRIRDETAPMAKMV